MNNIQLKVMKAKPNLTDEEIRSHMNFDTLLQLSKTKGTGAASTSRWATVTIWSLATLMVLTALVYFSFPKNGGDPKNTSHQNPAQGSTADSSATKSTVVIAKPTKIETQVVPIQKEKKSAEPSVATLPGLKISQFTEAEPINGYPALYEYFNRELKYPNVDVKDSIEGLVTVSFAINIEGRPNQIKISNSLGELFDKECLRVIENMPPWKAATVNGTPTQTRLSIPLTFSIRKN